MYQIVIDMICHFWLLVMCAEYDKGSLPNAQLGNCTFFKLDFFQGRDLCSFKILAISCKLLFTLVLLSIKYRSDQISIFYLYQCTSQITINYTWNIVQCSSIYIITGCFLAVQNSSIGLIVCPLLGHH